MEQMNFFRTEFSAMNTRSHLNGRFIYLPCNSKKIGTKVKSFSFQGYIVIHLKCATSTDRLISNCKGYIIRQFKEIKKAIEVQHKLDSY